MYTYHLYWMDGTPLRLNNSVLLFRVKYLSDGE